MNIVAKKGIKNRAAMTENESIKVCPLANVKNSFRGLPFIASKTC